MFIIRKTKLILNEYGNIFEKYFDEMREKDASVNEQIMSSSSFAISSI